MFSRRPYWYCVLHALLCELRNSFRRISESLKRDQIRTGVPLGAPRQTFLGERRLTEIEWRERTRGIETLHTVRPWASAFDLSIYLEGWNHAAMFYGRTGIGER